MRNRTQIALVSILLATVNCQSTEEKARSLYSRALVLQREEKPEEAAKLLLEIVSKFPDTETAVEVNKILLAAETAKKATIKANEEATVENLQSIGYSLFQYNIFRQRFPKDLQTMLHDDWMRQMDAKVDKMIASGLKDGYQFIYKVAETGKEYSITAVPLQPNVTGVKTFSINQDDWKANRVQSRTQEIK